MRQIGIATSIPFLMLGGPVVGYLIGSWLDGALKTEPYLLIIFSVLGLISGFMEAFKLIKRLADENRDSNNDL